MTTTTLWWALGWVAGWLAFGRPRTPGRMAAGAGPPSDTPAVTIVVPARNEELSLPRLLSDLARSRPPGSRVVVVDDSSTDRTARVATEHDFVELVRAPEPPAGWTGKCWACHTGAQLAGEDDVVVFLDADVRLAPGALDGVVAGATGGGLVSVQPWHDAARPYEQLSAVFNVVAVMGTGAGGRHPVGAFGPVMACTAAAYRAVGGHESVRDQVVEDVALAGRFSAHGEPVRLSVGRDAIRFRMFPAGPRQVVEGWTKNFASGAGVTPPLRLAAVVAWVAGAGSAVVQVGEAVGGAARWWWAAAVYGAVVAQLVVMFRRVGRFGVGTAVAFPLLLAFFVAVFTRSAWRTHVRRSVTWRGRVIPVGTARGERWSSS